MADGILKVGTITTSSGSGTITLGQSGETIALGATTNNLLTPAFFIKKTSDQTLTENTYTKITFDSETFDTDGAYASDKFTVPTGKAGKYFIGAVIWCDTNTVTNFNYANVAIYVNGSEETNVINDSRNNYTYQHSLNLSYIADLSDNDYVEVYTRISDTSGSPIVHATSGSNYSYFYGYRII